MGISVIPLIRFTSSKVKRGNAAGFSMPMVEINNPMSSDTKALSTFFEAMNIAQVSPSNTSQKYSKELKFSATSASIGAAVTSTIVPNKPPITENTSPAPSTSSAWPLRVMA